MNAKLFLIPALLVAVATAGYFGFDYYQAEQAKQAKVQKELAEKQAQEEKRLAREKEKSECLKEMPWETLDGVTLCDTVQETEKAIGVSFSPREKYGYESFHTSNDELYLDIVFGNGDLNYYTKIRYYRDGIVPNYNAVLQKLVNINGKPKLKNEYQDANAKGVSKWWCWGECDKQTESSIHCKGTKGKCLILEFDNGNWGTESRRILLRLRNNAIEQKARQSYETKKANEF